VPDLYPIVQK